MHQYLYLAINIGCILIPLLFSFHPKLQFYKEWKFYFPAMILVALFFLLWDEWFTKVGIWGFNERYITGIKLSHIPLEEILFFICIPYACTFTYFSLQKLFALEPLKRYNRIIGQFLLILSVLFIVIGFTKWYTVTTFGLLCLTALYFTVINHKHISTISLTYLTILPFFFISNGLLTGTGIEDQVVWYNNQHNLGIRMLTIPIEDLFYGYILIAFNIRLYEWFKKVL